MKKPRRVCLHYLQSAPKELKEKLIRFTQEQKSDRAIRRLEEAIGERDNIRIPPGTYTLVKPDPQREDSKPYL